MLFQKVIFLMLIILSHLQTIPTDEQKSRCNLIVSPLGYEAPTAEPNSDKHCGPHNSDLAEYRCCYQSYRIISSMTSSCKLIKWKDENEFKQEKQLLKDNNAKNITIDCGVNIIKENTITFLLLFFLFLF